jgi:hypothetical protein
MKRNVWMAALLGIAFALAGAAFAQSPAERPREVPPAAAAPQGNAMTPANPSHGSPPQATTLRGMAAEGLKGQPVYNRQAEEVATVAGVGEDPMRGRVAVLEVGGFFGLGAKSVAVPLERLEIDGQGRLVMDTTEDELKSWPQFQGKIQG